MPRSKICDYLESQDINANKVLLSAWSNYGNRPRWSVWKQIYHALNDLLSAYGLKVDDFVYEDAYTPAALSSLRRQSKLNLDDFAAVANETPQRILLYESESLQNTRGIGYAKFNELIKTISQRMSEPPTFSYQTPDQLATEPVVGRIVSTEL